MIVVLLCWCALFAGLGWLVFALWLLGLGGLDILVVVMFAIDDFGLVVGFGLLLLWAGLFCFAGVLCGAWAVFGFFDCWVRCCVFCTFGMGLGGL